MTASIHHTIPRLVPPANHTNHSMRSVGVAGSAPLPIPTIPAPRSSRVVYGIATVDARGRVADRNIVNTVGWLADQPLSAMNRHGMVMFRADPEGTTQLTTRGHLRIPARLRQHCGLRLGDRAMLVADPDQGTVLVYPPVLLDRLLADHYALSPGGGQQ